MEVGQGEWEGRCENLLSWKLLSTKVDPLEKRAGVKILETNDPRSCGASTQPQKGERVRASIPTAAVRLFICILHHCKHSISSWELQNYI